LSKISSSAVKGIGRDVRNGNFEVSDDFGLYLPKQKLLLGGEFTVEHRRAGELVGASVEPNTVVNEGLDHILSVIFNSGTQVTTWYVAIFEGNYTPQSTDTASNIASNSTESTAYDEATRVEWVEAAPSGQTVTNSANRATFNINATKTIYGAFLISDNTKSGTTGTLMAASRFSASRNVVSGDDLLITYSFSAADA
jgi:hypothetical protein